MVERVLTSSKPFLFLLLLFSLSSKNLRSEPPPNRIYTCASYLLLLAGAGVSVVAAGFLKNALDENSYVQEHTVAAKKMGYKFLGHGIYLDIKNIENILPQEVRELLKDIPKNKEKIVRIFNVMLAGDVEPSTDLGYVKYPPARFASSFFEGQSNQRGNCRHKNIILAAVLNHYGIKAEVTSGRFKERFSFGHAWVNISELNLIADPLRGGLFPPTDYLKEFKDIQLGLPGFDPYEY